MAIQSFCTKEGVDLFESNSSIEIFTFYGSNTREISHFMTETELDFHIFEQNRF